MFPDLFTAARARFCFLGRRALEPTGEAQEPHGVGGRKAQGPVGAGPENRRGEVPRASPGGHTAGCILADRVPPGPGSGRGLGAPL